MSDAEQFTAAVPERSALMDWRGGLERSSAKPAREPLSPISMALRHNYRAPLVSGGEREGRVVREIATTRTAQVVRWRSTALSMISSLRMHAVRAISVSSQRQAAQRKTLKTDCGALLR